MNIFVLDTHTLVWFLQKDKKLPRKSVNAIIDDAHVKAVPLIVFCEIQYLFSRGRLKVSALDVIAKLREAPQFEVISHQEDQITYLLPQLEIHDALIVATACWCEQKKEGTVQVISKDKMIRQYSPIPVMWE